MIFDIKGGVVLGSVLPKCTFENTPTSTVFPGTSFTYNVIFTNNGDAPGYYPFIDLYIKSSLYILSSATTVGVSLTPRTFYPNATVQCSPHPFTGEVLCGDPGASFFFFELPFASYYPSQPRVVISFSSSLRYALQH